MNNIKKKAGKRAVLFIRPSPSSDQRAEWLYSINKDIQATGELPGMASINRLKEYAAAGDVILILPGEFAVFHTVDIPGAGKVRMSRQLQKALPYWLEDKIPGEVDALEWLRVNVEPPFSMFGVDKAVLQAWISWFTEAELPLHRIVPDTLCLPVPCDEEWSCVQDGERWVIRQNTGSGMVLHRQWLSALSGDLPVAKVYGVNTGIALPAGWYPVIAGNTLECLAAHSSSTTVNLLKQPVGVKKGVLFKGWKYTVLLATLVLGMLCLSLFLRGYQYQQAAERMEMQSQELYREITQSKRKVSNPKFRLMQIVKNNEQKQQQQSGVMQLLNILAVASDAEAGIVIHSICYDGNQDALFIEVPRENAEKLSNGLEALSLVVRTAEPELKAHNDPQTVWLQMDRQK
ncbi:type II secretion system protein GspL [Erwinia sp. HDF1-3R]|uniref:type II secretion system protein GspL n=1 Tax=Erwinia sp. HDF1-3R TaxID=3141543 RepID=UPI0031F4EED6